MLVRGVPATVYDEGRSIEIYTGRVAIDIFSDTFAHALQAGDELRPLNAPGSSSGDAAAARLLPRPVGSPERERRARDGQPAPPRLPADRRPAGLHQGGHTLAAAPRAQRDERIRS